MLERELEWINLDLQPRRLSMGARANRTSNGLGWGLAKAETTVATCVALCAFPGSVRGLSTGDSPTIEQIDLSCHPINKR